MTQLDYHPTTPTTKTSYHTAPDCDGADSHCVDYSNDVLLARVISIDPITSLAEAIVQNTIIKIDTSLVANVVPGSRLLVHGSVALAYAERPTEV